MFHRPQVLPAQATKQSRQDRSKTIQDHEKRFQSDLEFLHQRIHTRNHFIRLQECIQKRLILEYQNRARLFAATLIPPIERVSIIRDRRHRFAEHRLIEQRYLHPPDENRRINMTSNSTPRIALLELCHQIEQQNIHVANAVSLWATRTEHQRKRASRWHPTNEPFKNWKRTSKTYRKQSTINREPFRSLWNPSSKF